MDHGVLRTASPLRLVDSWHPVFVCDFVGPGVQDYQGIRIKNPSLPGFPNRVDPFRIPFLFRVGLFCTPLPTAMWAGYVPAP